MSSGVWGVLSSWVNFCTIMFIRLFRLKGMKCKEPWVQYIVVVSRYNILEAKMKVLKEILLVYSVEPTSKLVDVLIAAAGSS